MYGALLPFLHTSEETRTLARDKVCRQNCSQKQRLIVSLQQLRIFMVLYLCDELLHTSVGVWLERFARTACIMTDIAKLVIQDDVLMSSVICGSVIQACLCGGHRLSHPL
jgi:hypothetical protein